MIALLRKVIDINIDKLKTCCFSGHRPEKLFGADKGVGSEEVRRLLSLVALEIHETIKAGYDTFITGMARGIDLWSARLVSEEKARNPKIRLICAIPFRGHGNELLGEEKYDYIMLKGLADEIVYVCEEYSRDCMQKRNKFMVDNSSKLIAVVSDYKSGTGQTIRLAKKAGIDVRIIDLAECAPMLAAGSDED